MRSWHPDPISHATGAAGTVMVGPRSKALASDLKHRLGVSYAKVSEALNDSFSLQVCRSGWCRADRKLAGMARPVYERLIELIRQCSVVHADETGWHIGTLAAWLWVFTNCEITVYDIRTNRSSDVVIDILGEQFKGILATDGFLAYDERRLRDWLKQKCVSHLLTDLKQMRESKTGRALQFAQQMTPLLQDALHLKAEKPALDPFTFANCARAFDCSSTALHRSRQRSLCQTASQTPTSSPAVSLCRGIGRYEQPSRAHDSSRRQRPAPFQGHPKNQWLQPNPIGSRDACDSFEHPGDCSSTFCSILGLPCSTATSGSGAAARFIFFLSISSLCCVSNTTVNTYIKQP